ncbi:MAG: hypothetical protein R3B13_03440 [Polyangiaceae bacterium]
MTKLGFSALFVSVAFACSSSGGSGGGGGASGTGGSGAAGTGATGGSGATLGSGPGPARSVEEYCQMRADLAKPWCDYAATCCSQADKDSLVFQLPECSFGADDPAECVTFVNERAGDGTMTFDGTWADACLGKAAGSIQVPPASCDGLPGSTMLLQGHGLPGFAQIPECRKMYVGLVKDGGACEYDAQCAEGLSCGESGAAFACKPVGTQGASCLFNSECDDGLICNSGLEQCDTLGPVGTSCLYADDCEDGLTCIDSHCKAPISLGGACTGFSSCAPGTGCSFSSSTCVALSPDGVSCTVDAECTGRCDSTTKKCVSICGGDRF